MLATLGTVVTRPCSPRFSSRKPSSISRPMFRFGLGIVDFLSNLAQDVRGDVLGHVLRIDRQHPDNALSELRKINDAIATSLSTAALASEAFSRPQSPV